MFKNLPNFGFTLYRLQKLFYSKSCCKSKGDVNNKTVLITGAANYIGRNCAIQVLRAQAKGVMLADRNERFGSLMVQELSDKFGGDRVAFIRIEPNNCTLVKHAFYTTKDWFGGLDIVINNLHFKPEVKWQDQIDDQLKGLMWYTKFSEALMGKNFGGSGGVLLNIVSEGYQVPPDMCPLFYGIQDFTMSFSRTIAPCLFEESNVRILTICQATCESLRCDLLTILNEGRNGCTFINANKNK